MTTVDESPQTEDLWHKYRFQLIGKDIRLGNYIWVKN